MRAEEARSKRLSTHHIQSIRIHTHTHTHTHKHTHAHTHTYTRDYTLNMHARLARLWTSACNTCQRQARKSLIELL